MLTRRGIEKDLTQTKYTAIYDNLVFYFSSEFYQKNFKKLINDYVRKYSFYLNKKFKLNINSEYFLAISCYKLIEKRGFRIFDKNTNNFINSGKIYEVK